MGGDQIALLHHRILDVGDHGEHVKEIVLFTRTDPLQDVTDYIAKNGGWFEVLRSVNPKVAVDDIAF